MENSEGELRFGGHVNNPKMLISTKSPFHANRHQIAQTH